MNKQLKRVALVSITLLVFNSLLYLQPAQAASLENIHSSKVSGMYEKFTEFDLYIKDISFHHTKYLHIASVGSRTYTDYISYAEPVSSTAKSTENFVYLPYVERPYPIFLKSGLYPMDGKCTSIYPDIDIHIEMCVTSVEVEPNGYMQFNMTWTLRQMPSWANFVWKGSDADNPNMNIRDNFGNRYNHQNSGGAAANITYFFEVGQTKSGWFLFPPAKQAGANEYVFHDDDQQVTIPNINLPNQ